MERMDVWDGDAGTSNTEKKGTRDVTNYSKVGSKCDISFFVKICYLWSTLDSIFQNHIGHLMMFTIFLYNRSKRTDYCGRDPFNQTDSDRSDREKWSTPKNGPVFSKLFRLDRTDPLSFGPKFPEILVEWIGPRD